MGHLLISYMLGAQLPLFISGAELLKRFKEEFANFEKERQELANAEKLFGLSITLYPELLDMEKELKGLDQIFSIYENQKASRVVRRRDLLPVVYYCNYFLLY